MNDKEVSLESNKNSENVSKRENAVKTILTPNEIQLSINQILLEKKISFERKSSTITADSNPTLVGIAKILENNKNVKVEIAGHTDSRGDKNLNKQISQDRANSVKLH